MKISILLPNFNSGVFVSECIQSLIDQTFCDYEVLIGDSGSDDGSAEVLSQYAATDERVKFLQIPREGIYPAWNRCLAMASGEYVYICTADDWLAPDLLETLLAPLERDPALDAAYSPLVFTDTIGTLDHELWFRLKATRVARSNEAGLNGDVSLRQVFLNGHPIISINQLLVRRSTFETTGNFSTDVGRAADLLWQLNLIRTCRTRFINCSYSTWRVHPAHATVGTSESHEIKNLEMYDIFLSRYAANDSMLKRILAWRRFRLGLRARSVKKSTRVKWVFSGLKTLPFLPYIYAQYARRR